MLSECAGLFPDSIQPHCLGIGSPSDGQQCLIHICDITGPKKDLKTKQIQNIVHSKIKQNSPFSYLLFL